MWRTKAKKYSVLAVSATGTTIFTVWRYVSGHSQVAGITLALVFWLIVVALGLWTFDGWRPHAARLHHWVCERLPVQRKRYDQLQATLAEREVTIELYRIRERVILRLRNLWWEVRAVDPALLGEHLPGRLTRLRDQIEGVLTDAGWRVDSTAGPEGYEFTPPASGWWPLSPDDFASDEKMVAAFEKAKDYLRQMLSLDSSPLYIL